MFIDTHLHLIDRSRLGYPWLAGVPALDRDFLHEEYALQARRLGIEAALHMEVDVAPEEIGAETGYISELAKKDGSLLRGAISSCRPDSPDFTAFLERQQDNPFVLGFRRVLHVMPDDHSGSDAFRAGIRALNGSRFTFDLCVLPHQIPAAMALADLAPDTQFILDHCGVPAIASGEQHPWRDHITDIARRPNVVAKISGVVAYADSSNWNVDTLRPYVEHVTDAFGFNRIVWGSDWPVCTLGGGLATWVGATHALFAGASEQERQQLYNGNARRIWSL